MSVKLLNALATGKLLVKASTSIMGEVCIMFRKADPVYVSADPIDLLTFRTKAEIEGSNIKYLLTSGKLLIVNETR